MGKNILLPCKHVSLSWKKNTKKTLYIAVNLPTEDQRRLICGSEPLKQTSYLKYLSAHMISTDFDLRARKGQAWTAPQKDMVYQIAATIT